MDKRFSNQPLFSHHGLQRALQWDMVTFMEMQLWGKQESRWLVKVQEMKNKM